MAAMARSGGRERPQEAATDIDDLLVRVRGLQKILPELARYRQAGRQQLRQRAETDGRPMGRTTTTRSPVGFSPPSRERDAVITEPLYAHDQYHQQHHHQQDHYQQLLNDYRFVIL